MKISFLSATLFFAIALSSKAQNNPLRRLPGAGNFGNRGGGGGARQGTDSLKHRTGLEDSITIVYRYLDTSRYRGFDSTITDFSLRFPMPGHYVHLGNLGNATRSLLFNPIKSAGWDPGFHAFDIYKFDIAGTKFYNTTRPYTEIGYVLGTRVEQYIHLLQTQNINPDWNATFEYQLINSPGLLFSQNTNHNSFRISSSYQSKNRRYHAFFVVLNNKIQSAENGGITNDTSLNDLVTYKDRSRLPVELGNGEGPARNSFFSSAMSTATRSVNRSIFLRQQYDLGIKDSIVTDSTVIRLFYPKFRIEHNFTYNTYNYNYTDQLALGLPPDTNFYTKNYKLPRDTTRFYQDKWRELVNDISIYQFPDSKNPQQFIKVGGSLQNLSAVLDSSGKKYYNAFLHGEYRNKTRNQKWDIEANGQLYMTGLNAGDYNAFASLKRYISKQIGYLQLGFQNVNREPSFAFNDASSFTIEKVDPLNKENIINLFAIIDQPIRKLRITGNYYLISNYTYYTNYFETRQQGALFNLLVITANKQFNLSKRLRWYAELAVQQKTGSAPVNLPLVFSRNMIEFAGNLGFKNLDLHFGTEIRYHTPYKGDAYSPLIGQFFYQNQQTTALHLPHIDGYLHFRIKTFTAYVRAANLNTARIKNGFGFTNNNIEVPGYPYPGLQFRLGIFWSFIN